MADKEASQELDEPDMSIDELSAAIDAHMADLSKKKKTKKKATEPKEPEEKLTEKNPETSKEEKVEVKTEPEKKEVKEEEPKEETETKVAVKRSYVSKSADTNSATVQDEEKGNLAQTAKVKLAPISNKSEEPKEKETKKEDEPVKTSMVDVVVKREEEKKIKPPTKKPEPKEEPKEGKLKSQEEEKERVEEKPDPKEIEPKPKQEEKQPEEKPEAKETPVIKNNNSIDELTTQMAAQKEAPKLEEPETLKTFDTKQYHIPIKPSRHHRRGSSFMVFIAVFAAILAVVYVLNELEIIDIAELISSY